MSTTPRSRRSVIGLGLAAATSVAVGAGSVRTAFAAPAIPSFNRPPEGYAAYDGQSTCSPTEKPGVRDFLNLLVAAYPSTGNLGIIRSCSAAGVSEHKEGRALDWRVSASSQAGIANELLNWLLATRDGAAHALIRRFGIMYMIWNRRIWRAYQPSSGWQPYNGTNPHTDHVHFSFSWAGARRETTWWTARGPEDPVDLPGLAVTSQAVNSLDVFATTTDNLVKTRPYRNGVWGCWTTLPSNAKVKGDPAAISLQPGRIDLLAQGIDNRLKKIVWTSGNGWYPWADLGTYAITSSPAATSRGPNGIDVFAKNTANKIVYRHFDTVAGWTTAWSNIGENAGSITASSAPAAVASPDGTRMNVFARAADGSLLSLMWTKANGWYNWVDRGQSIVGRPSASTRGGFAVDIFVRDDDHSLMHWYSPDGADWTSNPPSDFGGYLHTSPAAVSWNGQRIDVFSRNNLADLIRKTWVSGSPWANWVSHGAVGAPAC
ncbi:hypothetical protein [Tenggerimyces flavus]|uniref:Uncharacterized protein n=1 Tax=Tenggerimyces flavus TaxID=1708749 RepID=A0ABV7YHH1_9ACTN|nr:hypothetical protein [Tenggerimyces flavus]MBM7784533.1 hypothetical protein [Tenggerimyces flavus]